MTTTETIARLTPSELDALEASLKVSDGLVIMYRCDFDRLVAAARQLSVVTAERDALVSFLRDLSCDGCSYDDDCPIHGSNHGECTACKCRRMVERQNWTDAEKEQGR